MLAAAAAHGPFLALSLALLAAPPAALGSCGAAGGAAAAAWVLAVALLAAGAALHGWASTFRVARRGPWDIARVAEPTG